jgi:GDP-L-fucose synthase
MSLSKKKLLITGATGFIGRNLIEHFSKISEYEVHATHFQRLAVDIPNVQFHHCDLRNPQSVETLLQGMDILIQAAATTSGSKDIVNSPSLHVTDNAVMNSYLMRSAVSQKLSHVIFFSCTVMYPNSDTPLREDDFKSDQVYPKYFGVGWTKIYIEKVCEFFAGVGSTKFTCIRHSNIYGPHDKYDLEKSHVFGATITKVMRADKEVVVWGEGKETRDLLYVSDLINFVEKAFLKQTKSFELVNVGFGINISIAELVSKIIASSGKNLEIKFDLTKPNIPTNVVLDIQKAKNVFGWSPTINLSEGIEKTLRWYRKNIT